MRRQADKLRPRELAPAVSHTHASAPAGTSVAESLLSIADRSIVERERFEDDLEAARADYCEGEIAAPGLMACTHCDAQVMLSEVARLDPCHQCGHRYFYRFPSKIIET